MLTSPDLRSRLCSSSRRAYTGCKTSLIVFLVSVMSVPDHELPEQTRRHQLTVPRQESTHDAPSDRHHILCTELIHRQPVCILRPLPPALASPRDIRRWLKDPLDALWQLQYAPAALYGILERGAPSTSGRRGAVPRCARLGLREDPRFLPWQVPAGQVLRLLRNDLFVAWVRVLHQDLQVQVVLVEVELGAGRVGRAEGVFDGERVQAARQLEPCANKAELTRIRL